MNGIHSKWKLFETGVPQGSSLSPVLFIMYINDVIERIQKPIQIGMFADDLALWTSLQTDEEDEMKNQCDKLQVCCDSIINWSNKWRMILAPGKSQFIIFKSPHKIPNLLIASNWETKILQFLKPFEIKIICRLLTGKVMLNKYLYSTNLREIPNCPYCQEEESVGHFILDCEIYEFDRNILLNTMDELLGKDYVKQNFGLELLLVGNNVSQVEVRRKVIKATVKFVIGTGRKI